MLCRRRSGPFAAILLALLLLAPGWAAAVSARSATPSPNRPHNIVFVLTDDLDAASWQLFPQIKQLLVDQGVSFNHYFVTDSLCCPSRSSIFLGEYVHNHQVEGNNSPNGGYDRYLQLGHEDSNIATWLHDGGYRTGLMGKYLNQYAQGVAPTHVPPGWDEWDVPTTNAGYAEFNYTLNENGKLVNYGQNPQDYLVDVMSNKGDAFIQQSAASGKPFFLELATYAPHQPATPAPRYDNAFPNAQAPRTASFNEADVSDKPAWLQARPLMTEQTITQVDALYRKRLQAMLAVDDLVGNLVKTLQAAGQLDNTDIVFSSDNGFHLGQHRLPSGKQTAFETDIKVPLVIRGPGVAAGQTRSQLASNIDLAPTFAAWAGVKTPAAVDGSSLAPLLSASPGAWNRQATLVEHYSSAMSPNDPDSENAKINDGTQPGATPTAAVTAAAAHAKKTGAAGKTKTKKHKKKGAGKLGSKAIPVYTAMRTNAYVYVEYQNGARELYNLTTDPEELANLAPQADPALLKQLSARLATLRACAGASCRPAEDAPVPTIGTGSSAVATPTPG